MAPPLDLPLVAVSLGSHFALARAMAWGDSAATHRIDLADGRAFAVRRMAGSGSRSMAERLASAMRAVSFAGLPVPSPIIVETPDAAWLATPWVKGETGATWLDDADRARRLAAQMGAMAAALRGVSIDAVRVDLDVVPHGALVERGRKWLPGIRGELGPWASSAIDGAIDWLASAPTAAPAFAHGDFAPINVIVDPDGAIVALLDFEHAHLGPSLSDLAWWGWVVRHHHPDAWSASWPTFCAAAGVEVDPSTDGEIQALQLIRLLESAATATDPTSRARWLVRLRDTATW